MSEILKKAINPKLNRRSFLKWSAGVGGALAASGALQNVQQASAAPKEDVWVPTTCMACAPHSQCGLIAHRVDGVLTKLQGNPANPMNLGKNCPRSNAAIMTLYNPYRVRYPVKRTNPKKGRGVDPGWVQISWDEALNTVAGKLKGLSDPRKLVLITGHRNETDVANPCFAAAFGTPNRISGGTAIGCGGGQSAIHNWVNGHTHPKEDNLYCKLFINLGACSNQAGKGRPDEVDCYTQGRDNGLKVINVAPNIAPSCSKADEWVPIIPGTATVFMMSLVYVILNELKVWDADFLKKRTSAPYLVGPDGLFVRAEGPLVADPDRKFTGGPDVQVGPPLVWDPVAGAAKTYNDAAIKDFALEGNYVVNGVKCKPAFQLLKEHVVQFAPEKASPITSIEANTIRRIAKEWVTQARIGETITIDNVVFPYRPVATISESGSKGHIDNHDVLFSNTLLPMIVGAVNVPGATTAGMKPVITLNPSNGVSRCPINSKLPVWPPTTISMSELFSVRGGTHLAYKVMARPEDYPELPYQAEVIGIHGGNPQQLLADPETVADAFKKAKFVFAVSYVFDEPTEQADIVLPDSSWLERTHHNPITPHGSYKQSFKTMGATGTSIRQPVVDTLYDTKAGNDIFIELADRMGILYGAGKVNAQLNTSLGLTGTYALDLNTKYSWTQIVDRILKQNNGDAFGLDWFKANGQKLTPAYPISQFYGYTLFPNIRHPFYYEPFVYRRGMIKVRLDELQAKGAKPLLPSNDWELAAYHGFPEWRPHPEHKESRKDYDLYAISYKVMEHHYGTNIDNVWLMEWAKFYNPYALKIVMHPDAAKAKGVKDGDVVVVESMHGPSSTFTFVDNIDGDPEAVESMVGYTYKVEGEVKISNTTHRQVVAIGGSYGQVSANINPAAKEGASYAALLKLADECSVWGGGIDRDVKVKVYKKAAKAEVNEEAVKTAKAEVNRQGIGGEVR